MQRHFGIGIVVLLLAASSVARADFFFTGYRNGSITRVDERSGVVVSVLAADGFQDFRGMTLGPDGLLYVSARRYFSDQFARWGVYRFDPRDDSLVDVWLENIILDDITFGSDGKFYGVSGWSGSLQQFNGSNGAFERVVLPTMGGIWNFGPFLLMNDETIIAANNSRQLAKFDTSTGAATGHVIDLEALGYHGFGFDSLAVGASGELFASYNFRGRSGVLPDGGVLRIDPSNLQILETIIEGLPASGALSGGKNGLAFGPDGDLFVGSRMDSKVFRFDSADGSIRGDYPIAGTVASASYIVFLPVPVPEPTTVVLISAALVTAWIMQRRSRGFG